MDEVTLINEHCPRCGGPFHCGAADASGCACFGLTLSAGLMARLRADYTRCLCIACLQALQHADTAETLTHPGTR